MRVDNKEVESASFGYVVIFGALIVMWLSGCGVSGSLGLHPITSANHEQKWEPKKARCLFGNCNLDEVRGS